MVAQIEEYEPHYLVVSLGVDTYEKDMVGDFYITLPFYKVMGEEIAKLGLRSVFVMEGGYAVDGMGSCVVNLLNGFVNHIKN